MGRFNSMRAILQCLFKDKASDPINTPDSSKRKPHKQGSGITWKSDWRSERSELKSEKSDWKVENHGMDASQDQTLASFETRTIREPRNGLEIVVEGRGEIEHSESSTVAFESSSKSSIPASYVLERNRLEELGCLRIHCKSLSEAAEEAEHRLVPIFCVEVDSPGDVNAGKHMFSHPLLVEASNSLFVTVTVAPGNILSMQESESFDNFTKIRILNSSLEDIVPSVNIIPGDYDVRICEVLNAMVRGLKKIEKYIPTYLQLLRDEYNGLANLDGNKLVFATYDCQIAEIEMASLDGVLATRAGTWRGHKVIEVTYDKFRISYSQLVEHCLDMDLACILYYQTKEEKEAAAGEVKIFELDTEIHVFVGNIRANPQAKEDLRGSPLRFVPLTDLQATKCNRLVNKGKFNEAVHLLSPWQGLIMMHVLQRNASERLFSDAVDVPLAFAWDGLCHH